MTTTLTPDEWLEYMREDYLGSFIADGGASVKFAVPMDSLARESLSLGLQALAGSLGYLYLSADSKVVRVHMIDALFFGLSRQVPWPRLCRRVVADLAVANGYDVPSDSVDEPLADVISRESNVDSDWVRNDLRRELVRKVFRDESLMRDFRIAMMLLCMAELNGVSEGETTVQVVTEWLTGVNTRLAAVRPYGIQTRIQRTNARYLIEAMLTWIRRADHRGTVIYLDTDAVTNPKRLVDQPVLFYTRANVLDCYEVLRQFIDEADNLDACFLVVSPNVDFLEVEMPTRGMGCYEALKFRVYDEIRDRNLVNPMASLVRLADRGERRERGGV